MSRKILSLMFLLALVMFCTAAIAQDTSDTTSNQPVGKAFKLLRDGSSTAGDLDLDDEEEEEIWEPGLTSGMLNVSLSVGYLGLDKTLLQHDQIIYKYNTDATFWGDMELVGEMAFSPALRLGYSVTNWLTLQGWSGISISQYSAKLANTFSRKNEEGASAVPDPFIAEFDPESRSMITIQAGINAIVYPLAIGGEGKGRWHPYVTGGVGNMWYSMNSNYTEEAASAFDLNLGGGLRFLADKNISILFEVGLHRNKLQWTPSEYFIKLDEDTRLVPLDEFPRDADNSFNQQQITEFSTQTMNLIQFSIGVQGDF